jgi:hypothetical protein
MALHLRSAGAARMLLLPCALLLLLLALPWGLQQWIALHADRVPPLYAAQAQRATALATLPYYLITGTCALAALGASAYRAWPGWHRALVASGALALALVFAFTPWIGAVLQGPVKDAAAFARQRPEPAVQWEFSAPSVSVYRRRITPSRPPQPGELAITRVDRLDRLSRGVPLEPLFQEGGVALVRRRAE